MNNFISFISTIVISLVLTLIIVISGIAYDAKIKEDSRKYIKIKNVVLKEIKNKEVNSVEKMLLQKKREIEEINQSVSMIKVDNLDISDLNELKSKAFLENSINEKLISAWNKPFNYLKGSTCNVSLYKGRTEIKFKIYDCTGDAIFKRAVELSINVLLKSEAMSSKIKKYKYKNKLNILFIPQ